MRMVFRGSYKVRYFLVMINQYHPSSFIDVPSEKSEKFNVYHDESGTNITQTRFQLHGVLFVPDTKLQETLKLLQDARNGYKGRIHFMELRDKSSSLRPKVAAEWLKLFFNWISTYCFYKCMILDMGSPASDRSRLPEPSIIYNRTARSAIFSGIVWSLKEYDKVTLSVYSEAITRSKEDNFEEYIPRELIKRAKGNKNCPDIIIPSTRVILVNGDPLKVEPVLSEHCEFIQLTDLITGAVSQAINANASQKIKFDFGKLVATWINDTRLPPWLQTKELHRRFSVSCRSIDKDQFYDVELQILLKDQLKFDNL